MIAQNHNRVGSRRDVVLRQERTADVGLDAERLKVVAGDGLADDRLD